LQIDGIYAVLAMDIYGLLSIPYERTELHSNSVVGQLVYHFEWACLGGSRSSDCAIREGIFGL